MELSTMDRPISASQLMRQKIRKIATWLGVVGLLAAAIWATGKMIRPKLVKGAFQTALVERGPVSETISCTGTLELENRRMILAPATAVLQEIKATPGKLVEAGDTILVLDEAEVLKNLVQKRLDLQGLENRIHKQKLGGSIGKLEMEHQLELKKMEIDRLETTWKDEAAMLKMGGTPPEKVEQALQALDLARKELIIIREKNKLHLAEQEASAVELKLEHEKVRQQLLELEAQINRLCILAPIPGVVVSIESEAGSMIQQNQELVKISDLRTYKITGKIADKFSDQLSPGGKVSIVIERDQQIEGIIGNIRPIVEAGQVYFDVLPLQKDHPRFRPNLEVELRILMKEKQNTLRVEDGPFFDGSKKLKMFRVENDRAVAVEVTTGLKNMDYLEIENGLEEGDVVVISDVADFQHLDWVEIE